MTHINIPLDYDFLQTQLGDCGQKLISALKYFNVKSVLNVPKFIKEMGYEPDIGSVFLIGSGSCAFQDEKYGTIGTCNGTIIYIENVDNDELMLANDIYIEKLEKMFLAPKKLKLSFPSKRAFKEFDERSRNDKKYDNTALIYTDAVMQYLVAELLDLAGNGAKIESINKSSNPRINPRHLQLAVKGDEELDLLIKATIAGGGVFNGI